MARLFDDLLLVGVDWRSGGAAALAELTLPRERRAQLLAALRQRSGAQELLYLATCNRVETLLLGPGLARAAPETLRRLVAAELGQPFSAERLRVLAGEAALHHLFAVAAGLDSAQPGEREILGQVKGALREASEHGLCGPKLERLVAGAVRAARAVHSRTGLGRGRSSLAEIAVAEVLAHLAGRESSSSASGPVALIGVSPMTIKCGKRLAGAGVPLVIANRTLSRARELANELVTVATEPGADSIETGAVSDEAGAVRVETVALSALATLVRAPIALLSATGASAPVLDRRALATWVGDRDPATLLVVDLGVPPDVCPADAAHLGLRRVGMDEIIATAERTRVARARELEAAEAVLVAEVTAFRRAEAERQLAPALRRLQERYRETIEAALDSLPGSAVPGSAVPGSGIEGSSSAERERWIDTLARRLAHQPTRALRALAASGDGAAVDAFLAAAGLTTEGLETTDHRHRLGAREGASPSPTRRDGTTDLW